MVARSLLSIPILLAVAAVSLLAAYSCGCPSPVDVRTTLVPGAVALPESIQLTVPWETGMRHRIIRGYNVATHTGVNRSLRSNDAYAIDFDLRTGDKVLSAAPGQVAFAGPARGGWAPYGNIVLVEHTSSLMSLYAHLDTVAVEEGQTVARAALLGTAGGSGGVRPHLHFALYSGAEVADTPEAAGPYGGVSVLPEPFGRQAWEGLRAGQCIEA